MAVTEHPNVLQSKLRQCNNNNNKNYVATYSKLPMGRKLRYTRNHHVHVIFTHIIYTIICLTSVAVRKLQVAILARSSREMSLTDRIV